MARIVIWAIVLCLSTAGAVFGQTYTLAPFPPTVFSNTGTIINAGCIWTYLTGTTTPVTTYSTSNGTANANPIIADSAGRFIAYLTPGVTYRFVYENTPCSSSSHGSTLRTVDGISAVPTVGQNVDVTGTAGENLTVGDAAYLSDGSGSKNAGQWYQADADFTYASNLALQIGIVQATTATGGSVTLRLEGKATGLSVAAGTRYYVSATAGALTAAAPANARFVGVADGTTTLVMPGATALPDPPGPCQGRLTGTSGTPVTTADVTAAGTIYFTPSDGATCAVYDSTTQVWTRLSFTEITIALTCTASKPYDVFVYNSGGTLAAETLVWTDATNRATAVTRQNGVWVKSGTTTRRLVGSFYCNSSGNQTDDSFAKRNICNADLSNKVRRQMRVRDTTDTWGYNVATTWRQARASAANQLEFLACTGSEELAATVQSMASPDAAVAVTILVGIGLDATTTATATGSIQNGSGTAIANERVFVAGSLNTYPGVGRHVATWLEWLSVGTATTFYGDNGGTQNQSGIAGEMGL